MWQSHPYSTLITAPAVEPLTLAEAKLYLRVDATTENSLITGMIVSARQMVETYTRRALATQTWDFRYPWFMDTRRPLIVPKAPLQSVTSVTYLDEDGASQTLGSSNYTVRTFSGAVAGRGYVELKDDVSLPSVYTDAIMPVTVRAVCGYGVAADVPDGLKMAIYLMLGDLYEQRQETMMSMSSKTKTTTERLMSPYRLEQIA
jgi:uncharacterized phiE125 gp8 family phage protein